ncbi:glycosyltransferase family 4 protein [Bombella sp. TMW 2.2543]|uniref:Glycosyltransferase family 4 protein n=1 Tax=Bombella pluederhausensis TaxID=2967336 RepID=A0ABT3WEX4_9PROT|nr:glycosyltransferase family 1 protein [Bombella pluederhausensis]MCX5617634.1 glycosyltransferase family 4 protein [Bombella pluederhausensis]
MNASHPLSYILDISRLLSRAGQRVPTGIDRVELAYARYLIKYHSEQTYFTARSLSGKMGALPKKTVHFFINSLVRKWNFGNDDGLKKSIKSARYLNAYLFLSRPLSSIPRPSIYLLLSHHHLMKIKSIQNILNQTGAFFVPMVHDLIPIEYPEYARPRESARHKMRMETVIKLANAVIVPTNPVGDTLKRLYIASGQATPPIWTIPHGVHEQAMKRFYYAVSSKANKPYFVYISTIEPRKNHLLLLHLWRKMIKQYGKENVPELFLIGKRGWENENILDLLDRCPTLQGSVVEASNFSDKKVTSLLTGSNGLLFPSFAEGYGLPLIEAMSLSVPSICSDIPELREVGGDIPLYLDPLNTPDWEKAIIDFSQKGALWQKQKILLENWSPLSWEKSITRSLQNCVELTYKNKLF